MSQRPVASLLIEGARQILTMPEDRGPERSNPDDIGLLEGGVIACQGEQILWVGPTQELARHVDVSASTRQVDASGCVVLPGLVDAHTHLLFGGERSGEFHQRNQGATYQEIAAQGGGIASTMRATREADDDVLLAAAANRIRHFLSQGVTTLEVKSGYGLDPRHERRCLELIKALDDTHPVRLVPTFLGAHTVPPEFQGRRTEYLDLVCEQMIPDIARARLAEYCDVFCEEGAFDINESRRVLEAGKAHGLRPRIHAEQFTCGGGASLAAEVGASSCDHLEAVDERGMQQLAKAGTVGVLMPGTALFLGNQHFAPARALLRAGVPLALATDCNPGTSHSENLWLMTTLGCSYLKLTAEEALAAVTVEAARSLDRVGQTGSIRAGALADLCLVEAPHYRWLPYHMGGNNVTAVIQSGWLLPS